MASPNIRPVVAKYQYSLFIHSRISKFVLRSASSKKIDKKNTADSWRLTITRERGISPKIINNISLFIIDIFATKILRDTPNPQIINKKQNINPKSTINAGNPVGLTFPVEELP